MISLRLICGVLIAQISLYSSVSAIQHHDSYTCDSPIYCEGPILKTVQLARVFADSKTFVDMVSFCLFDKIHNYSSACHSQLQSLRPKSLNLSINWVVQMLQKTK